MRTRAWIVDVAAIVFLLGVVNLAVAYVVDGMWAALLQMLAAAVAVSVAHKRGYSWEVLGLDKHAATAGLRFGALIAVCVVFGVAVIALVPFSRGFLDDERFADISAAEAFFEVCFRIPVVTALTEELLFRAVLLAVLLRGLSTRWAVMASALLFGLWHVLGTIGNLGNNGISEAFSGWEIAASVSGVVVTTVGAGIVFAWLRLRSGSLVAPWVAHTAINASTFVAGLIVVGGGHI